MKKLLYILTALVVIASCQGSKPPVVSDSRISISVIIPETTPAGDAIYLSGPCTGGDNFAVGNPRWKLSRSGSTCSILLDPDGFIGNKTLADGFWFYCESCGAELDADGNSVTRTLSGREGEFVVARWSK